MKSQELQAKNDFDQQDAEKQKAHSQEIRVQVERQKGEIAQQTEEVQEDLDKVEPAVIEAQQAVKMIKKQNLVEIRSMSNPPPIIKMALESVCLLLGNIKVILISWIFLKIKFLLLLIIFWFHKFF